MQLRPYQLKLANKTIKAFKKHGPGAGVMIQAVTGSGKTVIGGAIALWAQSQLDGHSHGWLTHRQELHDQSSNSLAKMGVRVVSMRKHKPADRKWRKDVFNIVTPQMKRFPQFRSPGLLIVDEAHHIPAASWAKLVSQWQQSGGLVLGLTATPWRMSRQQGFTDWFHTLIVGPKAKYLQDKGYLATPHIVSPDETKIDYTNAKVMSTGDYAYDWMNESISMLLAHKPVVQHWRKHTTNLIDNRTMWFVPTVHCAHELHRRLVSDGDTASVLTAETPTSDRRKILAALKYKRLTHLISVDVLGEGIDVPTVPIMASLRPTKSLVIWRQQCGRVSRPKNERGGSCLILDYARNVERHGPPDLDIDWSLKPRAKRPSNLTMEITARCYSPECRDIFLHPAERECWRCKQPQYFTCTECHVDRRWTKYTKRGTACSICRKALEDKKSERRKIDQKKLDSAINYYKAKRYRGIAIKPYKRRQKQDQLVLFNNKKGK